MALYITQLQCRPHNSNLQILEEKKFELKANLNYRDPYESLKESGIETVMLLCGAFIQHMKL